MKLQNKKTGEIVPASNVAVGIGKDGKWYDSLTELNKDWEDAPEEPKEHWAIDQFGEPINVSGLSRLQLEKLHQLGNDFPSENATMKAVERLRAWERLKDKGLSFRHWKEAPLRSHSSCIAITGNMNCDAEAREDLDLLFSGEDD